MFLCIGYFYLLAFKKILQYVGGVVFFFKWLPLSPFSALGPVFLIQLSTFLFVSL